MTDISSYIQITGATTYFSTRLYATAWGTASAGDQASALIMATITIDGLPLKGWKVTPGEVRAFPRYIPLARGGYYIVEEDDSLVTSACAEEALELLVNGNSKRLILQNQNVKNFSIGDLSENYEAKSEIPRLTSARARFLLNPFIAKVAPIA
jgi:hypothetical protein